MKATIQKIQNVQNLNLVTFNAQETQLVMVSLELQSNLHVGSTVLLNVKATSVSIAKALNPDAFVSFENVIPMNIESIDSGEILTSLQLKTEGISLESIITTSTAQKMNLQIKSKVMALINASDISIVKVLS